MDASAVFKSKKHEEEYMQAYDRSLSLWDVPYESIRLDTSYGTTHILAAGPKEGRPLLLLNGFGFSATMWYPNVASLAERYRVYAVDVIGEFNRSEAKSHFREKKDYAGWMVEVLDRLGVEKAILVGHSNGGWHALNFAMHEPGRVERLVLLAPAASFVRLRMQFGIRLLVANLIRTRSVIIDYCAKWFVAKGNSVNDYLFEQFYRGILGFGWKHKILIPSVFTDEELGRIQAPVLLLIGDQEVIYSYRRAFARAASTVPHAETAVIHGSGHALSIERSDEVNERILRFLADL